MPLNPFKLERYFALYEFKAKYLLSPSDCESLTMKEVLAMAKPEALTLWDNLRLGYTESPGLPALRDEIAKLYENIPASQIVAAAPEEAIYVALNTLLQAGDEVVCMTPIYQSLWECARALGCTVKPWAVRAEGGPEPQGFHWRLPVEDLESLITPQTRLLIVNFPHNPTGYLPTRAEVDALVETARRHNLYLLCDEMYRGLEHNPADRLPPMADLYEKAVSVSGLSKTYALPGLRMGWLATQDPALPAEFLVFKDYTTICNSAPSEVLALMALQAGPQIIERNLGIVRDNLAKAQAFFAQHQALFEWYKPNAGSIAFPKWLGTTPLETFCDQIVNAKGVMVVPGTMFDYEGSHFRVGLGRRNLGEALGVVGEYLGEQM